MLWMCVGAGVGAHGSGQGGGGCQAADGAAGEGVATAEEHPPALRVGAGRSITGPPQRGECADAHEEHPETPLHGSPAGDCQSAALL